MARTSATRVGNGPGHGGPARGAKSGAPGPGRGITHRSVAELMALAGAREIAAKRWLDILNDPTHPHHAAMVDKAAARMDGAPTQHVDMAMRDVRPEDMTDEELAAIAARGRRPADKSAGDTD